MPDNALPWLYGAARRIVANEIRRRSRAVRLGARAAAQEVVAPHDVTDVLSDQLRVRAALAGLSQRDREVLMLAEWEQLNSIELASALGCSSPAAKVRLHRARRRFAALLGPDHEDLDMTAATPHGGTV